MKSLDTIEPVCIHSGADLTIESALAPLMVYHVTGGTLINAEIEASCDNDMAAFGSHVVGERVRASAYGVNWSGINLSSDTNAPGWWVGTVVVEHVALVESFDSFDDLEMPAVLTAVDSCELIGGECAGETCKVT